MNQKITYLMVKSIFLSKIVKMRHTYYNNKVSIERLVSLTLSFYNKQLKNKILR